MFPRRCIGLNPPSFISLETIGKGNYGIVYAAIDVKIGVVL